MCAQKKVEHPKVSVVTVCFNAEDSIKSTINSVISQDYRDVEYIIVDGGSFDKTVDIIKENENKISFLVSEKDSGIFDAMNKSLSFCNGEWIIFMNAGDEFYNSHIISEVAPYLNSKEDFVYGDSEILYGDYRLIRKAKSADYLWKGMIFSHQSLFSRLSILKEKKFRLDTISADFYLVLSCFYDGFKFKQLDFPISSVSPNGFSDKNQLRVIFAWRDEVRKIHPGLKTEIYYAERIFITKMSQLIKKIIPGPAVDFIRKIKNG